MFFYAIIGEVFDAINLNDQVPVLSSIDIFCKAVPSLAISFSESER